MYGLNFIQILMTTTFKQIKTKDNFFSFIKISIVARFD